MDSDNGYLLAGGVCSRNETVLRVSARQPAAVSAPGWRQARVLVLRVPAVTAPKGDRH